MNRSNFPNTDAYLKNIVEVMTGNDETAKHAMRDQYYRTHPRERAEDGYDFNTHTNAEERERHAEERERHAERAQQAEQTRPAQPVIPNIRNNTRNTRKE